MVFFTNCYFLNEGVLYRYMVHVRQVEGSGCDIIGVPKERWSNLYIHMGAVRKSRSQIYELMRLLCFARLLKPASR